MHSYSHDPKRLYRDNREDFWDFLWPGVWGAGILLFFMPLTCENTLPSCSDEHSRFFVCVLRRYHINAAGKTSISWALFQLCSIYLQGQTCVLSIWLGYSSHTSKARRGPWISASSSPFPSFHLSSRRPRGGERWCGEAISHIRFTYGCHRTPPGPERWCHPVRGALCGEPGAWEDFSLSWVWGGCKEPSPLGSSIGVSDVWWMWGRTFFNVCVGCDDGGWASSAPCWSSVEGRQVDCLKLSNQFVCFGFVICYWKAHT